MTQDDDDYYLPLSDLKSWIVGTNNNNDNNATWSWLQKAEDDRLALQDEIDEQGTDLFANEQDVFQRVHAWTSSRTQPDGIGGFETTQEATADNSSNNYSKNEITVMYVVSEQGGGFGDIVWASSRWLANLLAHAETCRELLQLGDDDSSSDNHHHPLHNISFLELGAGAAIPSLVALQCGARVLCTDQGIPDRIRCMAEGMECTRRHNLSPPDTQGQVLPHGWGTPVDSLLEQCTHPLQHFQVIVAADCCYMPWLHRDLLSSIQQLLDPVHGVALLTFALHGNTDHESVWNIKELAQTEFEFRVEQLPSQQLTPPKRGMGAQQGLVHVLRLTMSREKDSD